MTIHIHYHEFARINTYSYEQVFLHGKVQFLFGVCAQLLTLLESRLVMKGPTTIRPAFSLIELIVVIGIFAVLVGILLVGVQNVRVAASRTQNMNNLRQQILAVHQIAAEKDDKITGLAKSKMPGLTHAKGSQALFFRMLPYTHGPRYFAQEMTIEQARNFYYPTVKAYHNMADPSWDYEVLATNAPGKCSYALNMFALDGSISLIASIPDGCSQTIAIGDKFFSKCTADSSGPDTRNIYTHVFDPRDFDPANGRPYGKRRPTFADAGWHDVLPVAGASANTTRSSVPGKTFQVRPRPEDVDPSILQTAFTAGLTVAMFDGSVRTIRPSVDETVFWALVTPAGGEVVSVD